MFLLLTLLFVVSCSGASDVGVVLANENDASGMDFDSPGACLGLWQVVIDADSEHVDIVDLRTSNQVINVLGFLEPPALTNLNIDFDTLQIKPAQKYVGVDVILRNPLTATTFKGFDVRGVVFGPEVTNADGLTVITSPEFFTGVPFGYTDGMLGTPAGYAGYSGLAGYKYFCEGIGLNDELPDFFTNPANLANRGVFNENSLISRHYDLSWTNTEPPIDFFVFNYAVYANYHLPFGMPPYGLDDFNIYTANSSEAFCMSATEWENGLWFENDDGGGHISMDVEVWDWQGNISGVSVEADGVISQVFGSYMGPGSTDKSVKFRFDGVWATPIQAGDLDILITAIDVQTFGESWYADLLPVSNPMHDEYIYNCWIHTTTVTDDPGPCPDMIPITEYEAFIVESWGPPDGLWQGFLPEKAGMTATRDTSEAPFIIGAALRYYPVTFWTMGAAPADAEDPIVPTIMFNSPIDITADIAACTNDNIYLVVVDEEATLKRCQFDGVAFSEITDEYTFPGDIYRIAVDDEDYPIVLVKDPVGDGYTVYHWSGSSWGSTAVHGMIVGAGIRDFDYNPLQEHYVFVCSVIAIRMFAMDKSGVIQFTDNELFGTQPISSVPGIYIDQDDPDCHIVVWGTLNSATTYGRPVARFAAVDYGIPKTLSSLTPSSNGASAPGGAWVPGTDYMFVPAYDEGLGRITMPSDW